MEIGLIQGRYYTYNKRVVQKYECNKTQIKPTEIRFISRLYYVVIDATTYHENTKLL